MLPFKKPLILGLGATGLSCLEFLKPQVSQLWVYADKPSVSSSTNNPNVSLISSFDPELFPDIDTLIISPGFDPKHPVIKHCQAKDINMISDIDLFCMAAKSPIIGITGTNGKSSVTALVTHMLKTAEKEALMGGNIGIPALKLLTQPQPDFYILELSSFQLEYTKELPLLSGTILNISPDHLDRHGNLKNYQAIKERIFRNCKHPVQNRFLTLQEPLKNGFSFGLDAPKTIDEFGLKNVHSESTLCQENNTLIQVSELKNRAEHQIENALAALALCHTTGSNVSICTSALKTFNSLEHRCENLGVKDGVTWINDSKATNMDATKCALQSLGSASRNIILLIGGIDKSQDFSALKKPIHQFVKHPIIYGQDRHRIAATLNRPTQCKNLKEGLVLAQKKAQTGDLILLSPACASFDEFKNFEERGFYFKQVQRNLKTP